MFIQQKIDDENHFKEYLELRKLQLATRVCYVRYYRLLKPVVNELGLSQEIIDAYLLEHYNHKQIRAFVKHYLEYLDNREIRLYRVSGRPPVRKRNIISPEDADLVIADVMNRKLKYGILLAIITDAGLRRAEALAINNEDFFWKRWWIDKTKRCRLKIKGKGDKQRIVTISPVIMEAIKYYADRHPAKAGQHLIKTNRTTLTEVFQETCKRLIGETYRLHDLRKMASTKWFDEGHTLETIRDRLGHSSVKTTELYVQADEKKLLEDWENE